MKPSAREGIPFMASPDVDVDNALNGVQEGGGFRPWAWVHVRARTVFGNLSKNVPFSRNTPGPVASTPSALDHIIGASEQTSWRYIASDGNVYDLKDFLLLLIEEFLEQAGPDRVAALKQRASQLRPWPSTYPGAAPYER